MSRGGVTMAVGGIAALVGAGAAVLALSSGSTPVATGDKAAIEKIVREYILNHPEILPEAMQNLENRERGKVVATNRTAIEKPFAGAWEGAADGDVTLVEFFDYNCGYCKGARNDIDKLLAGDKKLRVVYREMPVLGQDSLDAARVSLVAAQQGKYHAFHRALLGGRLSPDFLAATQRQLGMDAGAVKKALADPAIDAELSRSLELQRALNLTGTPSWVVGDKVFVGAVGYDALKEAIAATRAAR